MAKHNLELCLPNTQTSKAVDDFKSLGNKYVCALLNSGGGTLTLRCPLSRDQIILPIQQKVSEYLCSDTSFYFEVERSTPVREHVITVHGYKTLCTIDYGAYLPTDTQKCKINSYEVGTIRRLLAVQPITDVSDLQSIPNRFVFNQTIDLQESKTVQFKLVKDNPNKNLAVLLKNNDLTQYVSAFANHKGGRIYCGVRNDGTVVGQIVQEKDKDIIVKSINSYIEKMIWPDEIGKPTRGEKGQWDISFEPVTDRDGNQIQSKYIVIVTVRKCPGGVFVKRPESYLIGDDGTVQEMELAEWKRRISDKRSKEVAKCDWSSEEVRNRCETLDQEMLRMIDEGDWDGFDELAVKSDVRILEIVLVVVSKWCAYYYRQNEFVKAEYYLKVLGARLDKSDDAFIFDAKKALVWSSMERSRGNYPKSYQVAKELLAKIDQISPCILTAESYIQLADMLTAIHREKQHAHELRNDLPPGHVQSSISEVIISFYVTAIQHLNQIHYLPESYTKDRLQKAYIHIAVFKLGWSLSNINEKTVPLEDIKEADELNTNGHSISGFRLCHYRLAKAFLCHRQSQHGISNDGQENPLELAIKTVKSCKELADSKKFKELSAHARKHAQFFKNEMKQMNE